MSRKRTRPRPAAQVAVTLEQAYAVYLLDARARRYSPRTLDQYKTRLKPFVAWLGGQGVTGPAQITAVHVRAWLIHEGERGLAATTVHTAARVIRAWFNFCVREEWISVSPMTSVAMPRRPKLVKPALSDAQAARLLRVPLSVRDKTIIAVLLDTGLRVAECCALNVGDVDIAQAAVHVRQGKGGKDRVAYVGSRTVRLLLRHLAALGDVGPQTPLFSGRRGRYARNSLYRLVRRAGDLARIPGVGPHMLRRTFALSCLRAGMDIYSLARLMGHSDITTLRHYLPLLDSDLKNAHEQYAPGDRLG